MKLATGVKNDMVLAQALNYLGDSYFYRGDYATARQQYDKAMQVATKSKNRQLQAVSRFNLARLDVVQGRAAAAIPVLKKLLDESETIGLQALSVQSSIYLAQALLETKKPADAATRIGPGDEPGGKTRAHDGRSARSLPDGRSAKPGWKDQRVRSAISGRRCGFLNPSAKKTAPAVYWIGPTSKTCTTRQ